MTTAKRPQSDEGMFVPYSNHDRLVAPAWYDDVEIPEEERIQSIRAVKNLHHCYWAGQSDALSFVHLIDVLQRFSPAYLIRSQYLAQRLNHAQDHLYFHSVPLGKMLSELSEIGYEAYADQPTRIPIVPGRDSGGYTYAINSYPSTYRWLWKLRQQLLARATADVERERTGQNRDTTNLWASIDTGAET